MASLVDRYLQDRFGGKWRQFDPSKHSKESADSGKSSRRTDPRSETGAAVLERKDATEIIREIRLAIKMIEEVRGWHPEAEALVHGHVERIRTHMESLYKQGHNALLLTAEQHDLRIIREGDTHGIVKPNRGMIMNHAILLHGPVDFHTVGTDSWGLSFTSHWTSTRQRFIVDVQPVHVQNLQLGTKKKK